MREQTPLPFAKTNKDAPLVASPGVELIFHVAIPSAVRRVVNRSAGSKKGGRKSDTKVARRNRKEKEAASCSLLLQGLGC